MYEVSDSGMVRSWIRAVRGCKRADEPRILRQVTNPGGYVKVNLSCETAAGRCIRPRTVHSLVLEAFVGPRPAGAVVRHLDGDKLNNRLENLRYGTSAENAEDTIRHGRTLPGSRNPNSRLTDEQVEFIMSSPLPSRQIAPLVGVTHGHVRKIRRGEVRG